MPSLQHTRHILLADDDRDDHALFQQALEELPLSTRFETVQNGEQLMQLLFEKRTQLPDILFLDLNLPRKNGFDCLGALKRDEKLKKLPVIIFTTSSEPSVINLLYDNGAHYYIRKPNSFGQLKNVIQLALTLTKQTGASQPPREGFVLSPQPVKDESK